jgi:membrane protease YdiL (CAAX protease family)
MENETRKQLTQFFIVTFIFSWLLWLPGVLTYFDIVAAPAGLLRGLEALGAIGPAVVALILSRRLAGKEGLRALLRSAINVKAHWKFWVGASLMLLCLHAASRLVLTLISSDLPTSPSGAPPLALIPYAILIFLVGGGLGEEIGWRGYALDRLQEKHPALNAGLLLAAIWIVWHLPLFFYSGTNQSLIPFWLWLIPVVALGVMMTWVYNNTGTVFSAALFHTVGNLAYEIFPVLPTEATPSVTGYVILTIFYVAATVVIVLVYGAKTLRRESA